LKAWLIQVLRMFSWSVLQPILRCLLGFLVLPINRAIIVPWTSQTWVIMQFECFSNFELNLWISSLANDKIQNFLNNHEENSLICTLWIVEAMVTNAVKSISQRDLMIRK
jgi:hypothetical protein